MLAQSALTLDHLSKGRFILAWVGRAREYRSLRFDFVKPVSRIRRSAQVIKLRGKATVRSISKVSSTTCTMPVWIPSLMTANAPDLDWRRRTAHARDHRRYADGWMSSGAWTPEEYAGKLQVFAIPRNAPAAIRWRSSRQYHDVPHR